MSDDSLFNSFRGIHKMGTTIYDKIEEISIDAKQREQITVIFDIAFELGLAFGQNPQAKDKRDEVYKAIRKAYIELASPMMVDIFDQAMKDYEREK